MKFQYPVTDCFITSYFDDDRNYSFAPHRLQLHEGIDFAPAWEDKRELIPIFSAQLGEVAEIGFDAKGYGHYIKIKHNARYTTTYAHLKNKPVLTVGDQVDLTTELGYMGNTGNSSGRHLHFTLQDFIFGFNNYVVPKVVDPFPLLVDKIASLQIPISVVRLIQSFK